MLVLLAHARALREEGVRPDEIEPIYLRAPDAQINWAVRGARPRVCCRGC
jgi:tRNA threonylcarbamoyladenosine biosynthesis protein TsaB